MSEWISVKDRMPEISKLTKFKVKMKIGSGSPKHIETEAFANSYHGVTRFFVGDWSKVTHWLEEDKNEKKTNTSR